MSLPPKRDYSAASRFLAAAIVVAAITASPAGATAQEKTVVDFSGSRAPNALELRAPTGWSTAVPLTQAEILAQDPQEQTPDERMTTSGFFLGIVGMLAGAAVGSGVGNSHCGEDCVPRYAAGGASVVGSLLIPVGVRIANEEDKNPLLSYAASVATGAALWAGFHQVPGHPVALAPFVAAPLQVWLVSKLERR